MVENISHWLRSVRPKTAADDDWASSPEAADVLAGVHSAIAAGSVEPSSAPKRRRGAFARRTWLPAGVLAGAAAVAVALASSAGGPGLPPPAGDSGTGALPGLPAIRPAAMLLNNFSSCGALLDGLRTHAAANIRAFGYFGPGMRYAYDQGAKAGPIPSASPISGRDSNTDTSTTNVQEKGVDEPDIVKTDHGRLIAITDGTLRVVDAASRDITGTLDLSLYQGWEDAQLLVDGDQALVILGSGNARYPYGDVMYDGIGASSPALSTYLFVDLAGQPRVTGSMRASGSYLDARMVDGTVRLVVNSAPTINFPTYRGSAAASRAASRKAVRQAPLSAWLPQYSITEAGHTAKYSVPCDQVSHPADYTATSMLTIYTLDLSHPGASQKPVTVAADGDTVYASTGSLYIASNPDWNCCTGAAGSQKTEIHRFDVRGANQPTYLGSGEVSGRLLSQYSLSDYQGSLRIATTRGDFGSSGQSSSVYVLNSDTLKVTGRVDGLGEGERIYAVRFEGPTAYVVTFRETDPLFVLDLSDPAAPKVVGSLHLTGYSDYLHDAGDGRLIGVGQDASTKGQVNGVQVSLFDLRDPAKPSLSDQVILKHTAGEDTIDPHAFLYWQPTGLLVVPIQAWDSAQSGKVLVLRVSGRSLHRVGVLANPRSAAVADDGLGIQRSLVVDGALWTVSGGGVQVTDPTTLSRRAWIAFD